MTNIAPDDAVSTEQVYVAPRSKVEVDTLLSAREDVAFRQALAVHMFAVLVATAMSLVSFLLPFPTSPDNWPFGLAAGSFCVAVMGILTGLMCMIAAIRRSQWRIALGVPMAHMVVLVLAMTSLGRLY